MLTKSRLKNQNGSRKKCYLNEYVLWQNVLFYVYLGLGMFKSSNCRQMTKIKHFMRLIVFHLFSLLIDLSKALLADGGTYLNTVCLLSQLRWWMYQMCLCEKCVWLCFCVCVFLGPSMHTLGVWQACVYVCPSMHTLGVCKAWMAMNLHIISSKCKMVFLNEMPISSCGH